MTIMVCVTKASSNARPAAKNSLRPKRSLIPGRVGQVFTRRFPRNRFAPGLIGHGSSRAPKFIVLGAAAILAMSLKMDRADRPSLLHKLGRVEIRESAVKA